MSTDELICPILLTAAPANVGRVSTGEILSFLSQELPDGRFYRRRRQLGIPMGAAFDWEVLISAGASVVTIAGALWGAYRRFVVQKRNRKPNSKPGLFVQVQRPDGTQIQLMIGPEYQNRDVFLGEFSRKMRTFGEPTRDETIEQMRTELEESGVWVRVSPGREDDV